MFKIYLDFFPIFIYFYFLYFNIIRKRRLETRGSLQFISLYLCLDEFCIDVPNDGLQKGQNI
jgi:hypothetical protein